jgi:hypothetical protein
MQWCQEQSNNCQTPVSNVSFSLSNNETYLSISLHSRRKSMVCINVFYSRIMAITRLRLVTQNHPHE